MRSAYVRIRSIPSSHTLAYAGISSHTLAYLPATLLTNACSSHLCVWSAASPSSTAASAAYRAAGGARGGWLLRSISAARAPRIVRSRNPRTHAWRCRHAHTAYVSMRQHTSAYVSIRQHTWRCRHAHTDVAGGCVLVPLYFCTFVLAQLVSTVFVVLC